MPQRENLAAGLAWRGFGGVGLRLLRAEGADLQAGRCLPIAATATRQEQFEAIFDMGIYKC